MPWSDHQCGNEMDEANTGSEHLVYRETGFDDARDRFSTRRQGFSPSFSVYHYNGMGRKVVPVVPYG